MSAHCADLITYELFRIIRNNKGRLVNWNNRQNSNHSKFLTREVTYLVLSEFSINLQMNYIWPPLNKNHSAKGQECRKKISIFFAKFFSKKFFEFFICCFSRSAWPQIDGIIKWCRIPGSLPSFFASFPTIRREMKNWIFRRIRNFGL